MLLPEAGVQRNAGVERADLGLRGVEGGAQLGIRGHALQVAHHAHGPIQRLGQLVQRVQRVVERPRAIRRGERGEACAGLAQQLGGGGLHVLGAYPVERNAELYLK